MPTKVDRTRKVETDGSEKDRQQHFFFLGLLDEYDFSVEVIRSQRGIRHDQITFQVQRDVFRGTEEDRRNSGENN